MASILRFSRHGRRCSEFSSMERILTSNKYNATNSKIILQHDPNKSNQVRSLRATRNYSIGMENHKVDDTVNKVDLHARKESKVSLETVEQLFEDLKGTGTPNESRSKLGNIMWTALEENGCVFDVSHYNLLLKIHLKNEYNFNPSDFLAQMEAKNVAPNRLTYQRLISRYCQLGDIEGAGRILEFMKKKEFTVNEHVYNALIMGHARSNNMEAAKGVIDSMRNSKMDISFDTYVSLLSAYAVKGDIDNIRQFCIIEEKGKTRYIRKKHYLGFICNLAKNGHFQYVVEIIDLYRKFTKYNLGMAPVISKLVNCGREEVAMQLLGHLPPMVLYINNNNNKHKHYQPVLTRHFFIRQLVELDRPIEKIVQICKHTKTSGMNTQAFQKAIETALKIGKSYRPINLHIKKELALKLIKAMKEEGLPVRTRYFWPILINSKKYNDSELYDIFDSMMVYGCPANYSMFVYFYSLISTDDYNVVITKLRDFGYTLDAIVSPLVEFYITEKKLEKACSLLNEYPIRTNVNFLIRRMAVTCKQTNNVKTTVELLLRIKEKADRDTMDRTDIVGQFLLTYCRVAKRSVEKTEILAKEILQNRLQISPEMCDLVRRLLQLDEQDSLTSILQTLASSKIQFFMEDVEMETQSAESSEGLKANKSSLGDMTQQKAKDDHLIKKYAQYLLEKSEKKIERQTQGRNFWLDGLFQHDLWRVVFVHLYDFYKILARNGYPKKELYHISMAINISKVFSYLCGQIQNQRRNVPNTIRRGKIMKSAIAELEDEDAELEDEDAEWEALKVEFEAELDALNDRWAIELVDDLKAAIAELKTEDVELEAEDVEFEAENAEVEAEIDNLEAEEKEYYTDWGDDEYSDWEWEDNEMEGKDYPIKAAFEFSWKGKNYDVTTKLLADILCVSKKIKRKTELPEFWLDHLEGDDMFRRRLIDFLGENGYPDEELDTISIATNITKVFSFLIRIMRNQ